LLRPRRRRQLARIGAIIGCVAAESGRFAHPAYIVDEVGDEDFKVWTGTVLSSNVILTAGHCGEDEETGGLDRPEDFAVVTGERRMDRPISRQASLSAISRLVICTGYLRSLGSECTLLVLSTSTTARAVSLATYPSDAGIIEAGDAAACGLGQDLLRTGRATSAP